MSVTSVCRYPLREGPKAPVNQRTPRQLWCHELHLSAIGMTLVSSRPPIRVLVVDRDALVREGVTRLLTGHDGLQVVALAATADAAINEAARSKPDVAVIDADLAGSDLCAKVRSASPRTLCILHANTHRASQQRSQADAVVLKQLLGGHLADTIRHSMAVAGPERLPIQSRASSAE